MAHINSALIDLTDFSYHMSKAVFLTIHKGKKKKASTQFLFSFSPPIIGIAFKQASQGQTLIIFLSSHLAKFTFPFRNLLKFIPFSMKLLLGKPHTYFNITFWFLQISPSCHICYQTLEWIKYLCKSNFSH